jgi:cytochrome c2
MVQWLRFPQRIVPGNAMPDLGISEDDAQRLTAYLATLK